MPDILSLIKKRRSIRKYKNKPPSADDIDKILEAGRWAPSGLNNQPWRFLIIQSKEKRNGLAKFTKYGSIIKNAPVALIVCMDTADSYNRDKDLMAIGACIENMLLEAASLKLGTCWLGEILNRKEEVLKYLKSDPDLDLMAVIAVGYPLNKKAKGYRKPLIKLKIA